MRPLTVEEKARSQTAKKKANQRLQAIRKEIAAKRNTIPFTDGHGSAATRRREELLLQFDMNRDIKGYPVIVSLDDKQIILDYELLRRLFRTLKNRNKVLSIETSSGSAVLVISHHVNLWGKDKGYIELIGVPPHKAELLTDLPIVDINFNIERN